MDGNKQRKIWLASSDMLLELKLIREAFRILTPRSAYKIYVDIVFITFVERTMSNLEMNEALRLCKRDDDHRRDHRPDQACASGSAETRAEGDVSLQGQG